MFGFRVTKVTGPMIVCMLLCVSVIGWADVAVNLSAHPHVMMYVYCYYRCLELNFV